MATGLPPVRFHIIPLAIGRQRSGGDMDQGKMSHGVKRLLIFCQFLKTGFLNLPHKSRARGVIAKFLTSLESERLAGTISRLLYGARRGAFLRVLAPFIV